MRFKLKLGTVRLMFQTKRTIRVTKLAGIAVGAVLLGTK
jgi:hypothetical protein